jgi:predicted phosphoadenosine phosphosulfate sulfurtransferase
VVDKKMTTKKAIELNVFDAAKKRISYVFDRFDKIYVSFSGGKDSTVMTHLVMAEAIKRNKKVGLFFVDMEAQYKLTIEHAKEIYEEYKENIVPFWCAVPIILSNAVSQYEPRWICWEQDKEWTRQPDQTSITDTSVFPFYKNEMEFEEFTPEFGKWFANGEKCACFVGIRSDESLNRYRTIKMKNKSKYNNKQWTTLIDKNLYNVYPIYDWKTEDIWRYNGKFFKSYNKIYDLMHKAGVSIHEQRLCQPYGVDQRKGLWLFHILEPETWSKIVSRVNGANSGSEFVQYSGNVSGQIKITKPEGHTWKSFVYLIIGSMPEKLADHYDDKISMFLRWWCERGGYRDQYGQFCSIRGDIPDEVDPKLEAAKKAPSWKRICKTLLRNDYWCKGLSFSQTNSHSYQRYKELMKKRKKGWGHIPIWRI